MRCNLCGSLLTSVFSYEHGVKVPRMACSGRVHRFGCAGIGSPRIDHMEAGVLAEVVEYVRLLRINPGRRVAAMVGAEPRVDADRVREELVRTREAMARLTERWARRQVRDDAYDAAMTSLTGDEERLQGVLAEVDVVPVVVDTGRVISAGQVLVDEWPHLLPWERNAALRVVLRGVRVRRRAYWGEPTAGCLVSFDWI